MPLDDLHTDRARAESFGSVAANYDRFRSGYPSELFRDLLRSEPRDALDVGCGTGKVAVALARRGVPVLGLDPDERMAAVARERGVRVETCSFERWPDAGRQFDLIVSGHAWHWVDPDQGIPKAARLLRAGGTIARFWNYHAIDPHVLTEFEAGYRELAPEADVIGRDATSLPDAADPFSEHHAFTSGGSRRYRWHRTMTAAQWAGLVGTFGDHLRLGPERLAALQAALTNVIDRHGGTVDVHGGTYLLAARRTR